jgi:hypothetical protein
MCVCVRNVDKIVMMLYFPKMGLVVIMTDGKIKRVEMIVDSL